MQVSSCKNSSHEVDLQVSEVIPFLDLLLELFHSLLYLESWVLLYLQGLQQVSFWICCKLSLHQNSCPCWCRSSWILGNIFCKLSSFHYIPQIYPYFLMDLTSSSFFQNVYVHWTTKYSEMTDFWFLAEKYLFRCLLLEYSMWSTVLYIHSCSSSFCP